jgi:glycogen debranching enzyme
LPSIARNDDSFQEQGYWRGRIWGPMNFLVYLGLKNYDLPEATDILVKKSNELLMQTWQKDRKVHENYNGNTGNGRNEEERINLSDSYYHWGALLSFMTLIEDGHVTNPTKSLI